MKIIHFLFRDTLIQCFLSIDGQPLFSSQDIRQALQNEDGIHKEMTEQFYTVNDLVGIATEIESKRGAWEFLQEMSKWICALNKDTKAFWSSYFAVACLLTWKFREDEPYWHAVFTKHLSILIPGASIIDKRGVNGKGWPDFFISIDGNVSPVEIKKRDFSQRHVQQLRRYMQEYGLTPGFAVAQTCSAQLDNDMIFVSLAGYGSQ